MRSHESLSILDKIEDRRLRQTELQIPAGIHAVKIEPKHLRKRLDLTGIGLEEIYRSTEKNKWMECEYGNFLIESPDFDTLGKKLSMTQKGSKGELVILADMDDTLFQTTLWHKKEQSKILAYLEKHHVEASEQMVQDIYEFSKVYVPGVAEVQTRYTPVLNMILLDQFMRRQIKDHLSSEKAFEQCQKDHTFMQERIQAIGEGALQDYVFDPSLLMHLIKTNSTKRYMKVPLIRDLFAVGPDGPDSVVRIIITRGKIEGPLGQIYKVHQADFSMLPSLDMVIYTNDVKITALASVVKMFPQLKDKQIFLYDDNPSEIVPFYEDIEKQGMNPLKLEIVQVRHSDSKRRDKKVTMADKNGNVRVIPSTCLGYEYRKRRKARPIEAFDEIQEGSTATIFDHFAVNNRGVSQVV